MISWLSREEPVLLRPCRTREQLQAWVRMYTGLQVPMQAICPEHQAPMDYLWGAYSEPARDQVVWASRGGGKTRLGAVATLLDLLHKPGVGVRILGGSLEQSCRMWESLRPDLNALVPQELVRGFGFGRRVELKSGSKAGVVAQSEKSVRGLRVQKLRCDEVELFDDEIWEAAQLTVKSTKLSGPCDSVFDVRGTVEALSTHHKPWGLMSRVLERAREHGTAVVHWCLLDVLEKCPAERPCQGCLLWDECQGRAKEAEGFYRIDDAIDMKRRVSTECWQTEMLSRRPIATGRVFPSLDRGVHVLDDKVTR
jgi:hypothetical protein